MGIRCVSGSWRSPERGAGAGGVEVAQRDDLEAVRAVKPAERALVRQLRFAVRVDRTGRHPLVERRPLGHAVDGARRREHDRRHARVAHRFEQADAGNQVVAVVTRGIPHRLADERIAGHVDDRFDAVALQRIEDVRRIDEIAFNEPGARIEGVAMAAREIVEDGHVVAAVDENIGHHAADVARAAGDEDAHVGSFRSASATGSRRPARMSR